MKLLPLKLRIYETLYHLNRALELARMNLDRLEKFGFDSRSMRESTRTSLERERGRGTTGTRWTGCTRRGIISDSKSKAESVVVTVKGVKRSRKLFEKHFGKKEPDAPQR